MIEDAHENNKYVRKPAFLVHETAAVDTITRFPWNTTQLGIPSQWPSLLKHQVAQIYTESTPVFFYWIDTHTVFANDSLLALQGFMQEAVAIGEPQVLFGEQWSLLRSAFKQASQGIAADIPEMRLRTTEGEAKERIFSIALTPAWDEQGQLKGICARWAERTATVQELKTLRTYRENNVLMMRQSPVGICIVTGYPLQAIEVSDVFLEITGKDREEFLTKPYWDVNQEIREVYEPISYRVVETGGSYRAKEHQVTLIRRGIPEMVYVDFVYEPLKDNDGYTIGLMVVAIDVTEKSKNRDELQDANAELAATNEELIATNEDLAQTQVKLEKSLRDLKDSEQRIKDIIAGAPFPIGLYTGKEMRIIDANKSIRDTWGKGDNVIGKTYEELLPELREQDVFLQLDRVFTTGIPFHIRNQRLALEMSGEMQEFYFNYSFTPLRDANGQVYGVLNTAADVTDLYLSKQKVEQSERNFRSMIHQAPVAMCLLTGADHIIELANEAMMEIWGKPRIEVMSRPVFEAMPDMRAQGLEQAMQDVYANGVTYSATEQPIRLIRYGTPDVVYQNFVYQPYLDGTGKILGILAISVNVTEQFKARQELERAYEQLRLSKDAALLGTFDMDMVTGRLEWDRRCRELFGVDTEKVITFENEFKNGIHLDDRERILKAIDEACDYSLTGGEYDVEYRTVAGTPPQVRWVRARGKVYFDEDNRPFRFAGSVLEITDQKQKELWMVQNMEKLGRLAALVDTSEDVIISQNMCGTITSWNGAAERMFGYEEKEVLGKSISIIHPEDRKGEADILSEKVRAGEKVHQFETIRLDRFGREKHLSLTLSPVLDTKGDIIGVSKIARDISTQKEAQAVAARYTARLEVLNKVIQTVSADLDMGKMLQKVTDDTTQFIAAEFGAFFYKEGVEEASSYALYSILGHTAQEVALIDETHITEILDNTFTQTRLLSVADIRKDNRHLNIPRIMEQWSDGQSIANLLVVPVTMGGDEIIGGMVFGHSLPDQFTSEHESLVVSIATQVSIGLENAKLYKKVKDLNDKKDEFIGLASHELKTPLTSIHGYIQILERRLTSDQEQLFLKRTGQQVKKLTMLVNDLLDVSKIEAGKLKFTLGSFDLVRVITECVELVAQGHPKYTISFDSNVEACWINADSQRIEQVIVNLLNNAIKYSPGTDRVILSLVKQEDHVLVGVQDFGIGIGEDQVKKVFSRFYRVDDNAPNISGLGLGLFLSHEIIIRHQGHIWVESELKKGSTFWFRLPI